jgi:signal transduction histidine kinase
MRPPEFTGVNPYFLLPLVSALACLVLGVLILARGPAATENRCAAALLLGGAFWGVCEAFWTVAPDARHALIGLRVSALGWIAVGPIALQLFLAQDRRELRALRRALPITYGFAALCLALEWSEPWLPGGPFLTREMVAVPWGWAYRVGPLYPLWYAFTVVSASLGASAMVTQLRREASPAETRQSPWYSTSVGLPLLVGSTTDGLLPALGVEFPRFGVFSFAVFGGIVVWSMHRFGFSLVAPSAFAERILETIPDGVALATLEGKIRVANPSLAELLDVPIESLLDRRVESFLPGVSVAPDLHLDDVEHEIEARGERVPVALTSAPLRDRQGALIGLVLVVRDLREMVSLRVRLLTSARLAAVGELAAGLAHEINNPLAYIGANLRALRQYWTDLGAAWRDDAPKPAMAEVFDEGAAMLDDSLEGVERTAAIVRDVRVFSRGGGEPRERCHPNELLERALRVAAPQLGSRIRVERDLTEVGEIDAAPRELERVFLNVIVNAAQAIAGDGTIRLRTARRDGAVEVTIADDGPGIAPRHLDRIFDPFFTTKPVGEGTGLGLSISHEIVRRHGGSIDVSSEPGRGAEFRIRLPAA